MTIDWSQINLWAVLAAGFAVFMLGGLWYTALFGKLWLKLHGYTEEQAREMQAKRSPAVFFGGMFACYIVLAFIIAIVYQLCAINSVGRGIAWGAVLWVAPTAALKMTDHIASCKPIGAFWIDASFQFIALTLTGAIVAGW